MTLDCEALHDCADLLHAVAAERMAAARSAGRHRPAYTGEMREVAALEEVAAEVEAKIEADC